MSRPPAPRIALCCTVCGADPVQGQTRLELNLKDPVSGEVFVLHRCGRCASHCFLAEVPIPSELGHYYQNPMGQVMVERPSRIFETLRAVLHRMESRALVREIRDPARELILDVGAGDGSAVVSLARRGFRVAAWDVYAPKVWAGRLERAAIPYFQVDLNDAGAVAAALVRVRSQVGGADKLHVLTRHVMEHVYQPPELLRAFYEGGVQTVLAVVPNLESRLRKRMGEAWGFWDPPRHVSYFSPSSFADLFRRAGFTARSVRTYGIDEFVSSSRRRRALAAPTGTTVEADKGWLTAVSSALAYLPMNSVVCGVFTAQDPPASA